MARVLTHLRRIERGRRSGAKRDQHQVLRARAVVGVEYESWYGMFAPTGTPRPVIERLHTELSKVVRDKAYGDEKLGKIGLDPFDTPSPAAAAAFLRNFYDTLAPVIKKAGIKAD